MKRIFVLFLTLILLNVPVFTSVANKASAGLGDIVKDANLLEPPVEATTEPPVEATTEPTNDVDTTASTIDKDLDPEGGNNVAAIARCPLGLSECTSTPTMCTAFNQTCVCIDMSGNSYPNGLCAASGGPCCHQ